MGILYDNEMQMTERRPVTDKNTYSKWENWLLYACSIATCSINLSNNPALQNA